jgi:hypothetical protein
MILWIKLLWRRWKFMWRIRNYKRTYAALIRRFLGVNVHILASNAGNFCFAIPSNLSLNVRERLSDLSACCCRLVTYKRLDKKRLVLTLHLEACDSVLLEYGGIL